jgi:ubiquinone/menaquinone biosynthesis C-methylase UbiE
MAQMFANAIGYQQLMGRWSVRLAPLYVEFAKLRDEGRVLDVGCGTGALVKVVAGITRQSEIVGVDPAQSFVDYARTQITDRRIKFEVGDAMHLPFPTASFDQTLSLLVMMFIPEPERAAKEMKRVTRPGGTVSACTWDRDGLELASIFWEPHLRGVAPQGAYVASLSAERREALREALRKRLLGTKTDGSFSLHAKALAVRGVVPG